MSHVFHNSRLRISLNSFTVSRTQYPTGFGTALAYYQARPDRVRQIETRGRELKNSNFGGGCYVSSEEIFDQPTVSSTERHSGHARDFQFDPSYPSSG